MCESSARNVGPNVYTSLMETANDSTCTHARNQIEKATDAGE